MNSTSRPYFAVVAPGIADLAPSPRAAKRTPRRKRWFIRFMLALRKSRQQAAQRELAARPYLGLGTDETIYF